MNIVIFGAGQIGSAIYKLQYCRVTDPLNWYNWDKDVIDVESAGIEEISQALLAVRANVVINALPFHLNAQLAQAALEAGCHYLDLTEDDDAAARVQAIYAGSGLTCAVKCGLAPGVINYIGHDLVKRLDSCDWLDISVGALPRAVSYHSPLRAYSLSWSVDGLVNEYIKPCRIRECGEIRNVPALSRIRSVIIDGRQYEDALTSGGIGSLVDELVDVPNVKYKSLRYPGHFPLIRQEVLHFDSDFDTLKNEFEKLFKYCRQDVVVMYAEAVGMKNGRCVREVVAGHLYGKLGLSAIQTTTACGLLAVLELIDKDALSGVIRHGDVSLSALRGTRAFRLGYGDLTI